MVSTAAEINDVLIDLVGIEAARLEVGVLIATGTSAKSSLGCAVDVDDDIGEETVALVRDCLTLVASEANCVPFVPIRGESGNLEAEMGTF